jgi:mxaJ protein
MPPLLLLSSLLAVSLAFQGAAPRVLRVCADPNNLPFSNERREGFENRLAELVARELHATVQYTWWAQRRGYVRNTLKAGRCDVIMGVPTGLGPVLVTRPYYRSTYAFVTRRGGPRIASLDDARLRRLRVGVQIIGDDFANAPPAMALSKRGIVRNVRGYSVLGDYREPNPPSRIIRAVANGDIDVGIAWGPLAGYFAPRAAVPLRVTPVSPEVDVPYLPFVFDIAMGVRREDTALRDTLDAVLLRRRSEIDRLLADYGVPRADTPAVADP